LKVQVEREKNEKEAYVKQLKDSKDDARRRITQLEQRNHELESDNTAMHAQLKNNESKLKRLNDVNEKAKLLETEKL